jgi:pilus assembly protein FimV
VTAAAAPAKPAAKPAPPPPQESSFLDDLLDNPLALAGAGLVVLLAAGFGFYRFQQRKKTAQVDSSFLESRLQPDSFFGASGGQRIDTNEGGVSGSSMVYSPSQLDAAGDVDPVAEADVYLAYGRDLQAEEILKEALRTQPQRVAIHAKLLEIYSKRRDAKAFELVATDAYGLTNGEGPDWEKICELGQELDPANPLYRPGGQPSEGAVAAAAAAGAGAAVGTFGQTMQGTPAPADDEHVQPDIDLDLDFSLDDPVPAGDTAVAERTQPVAMHAPAPAVESFDRTQGVEAAPPGLDLDFGTDEPAAAAPAPAAASLDAPDLVLDEHSLNFEAPPMPAAPAPAPVAAAPKPAADEGLLEFDLGSLSLDLPGTKKEAAAEAPAPMASAGEADSEGPSTAGAPLSTAGLEPSSGDPLATKLALAQEFNAIGDPDGARTLAQEVIAEASGELKTAAQKFLAEIS